MGNVVDLDLWKKAREEIKRLRQEAEIKEEIEARKKDREDN